MEKWRVTCTDNALEKRCITCTYNALVITLESAEL
jgi:hypothetical protein